MTLSTTCIRLQHVFWRVQDETSDHFTSNASIDLQDIVAYRLIIIGEASAMILKKYPQFRDKYPEIPLQQARGMRNTLVHEYHDTNWMLVWNTVQEQLPQLISAIEPLVSEKIR